MCRVCRNIDVHENACDIFVHRSAMEPPSFGRPPKDPFTLSANVGVCLLENNRSNGKNANATNEFCTN